MDDNPNNKWIKSFEGELYDETECPDYDILVSYYNQKADSKTMMQIEKHLPGCELCSSILESLPEIEDMDTIEKYNKQIRQKIHAATKNETLIESDTTPSPKLNSSIKERIQQILGTITNLKPIFKTPAFQFCSAAIVILIIAFTTMSRIQPQYYEHASLNTIEIKLLHLISDRNRGDHTKTNEFTLGASLLLNVEYKKLGLIKSFDKLKIEQAITHLNNAYKLADEPFYKNKCAYFIGKAYLMNSDVSNAQKWFNVVIESTESSEYQEAALKIMEGLAEK